MTENAPRPKRDDEPCPYCGPMFEFPTICTCEGDCTLCHPEIDEPDLRDPHEGYHDAD